jgi:hypothetical protein
VSYRWQLETTTDTWIDANNGELPYNGGTINASGVDSDSLRLTLEALPGAPAVRFRCIVTNPCGATTTDPAALTICSADFNCNGVVDSEDFFDFANAFFTLGPAADFNHDNVINSQDFFDFLTAFFAGC